jgi:hypothetical protein
MEKRGKLIVFGILTVLVFLIALRISSRMGTLGEKVLEKQVTFYERVSREGIPPPRSVSSRHVEEILTDYLGLAFQLPEDGFTYFRGKKITLKGVRVVFIPLLLNKKFYLLGVYRRIKHSRRAEKNILDTSTILSGEREGLAFVIFEGSGGFKVSLVSQGSREDLFEITRKFFMGI